MANHFSHIAVSADNVDRARRFYERVFGWGFEPWGPPDFYLVHTSGPGQGGPILGALQKRFEIRPGLMSPGYECTMSVPDIDATAEKVGKHGGRILMPRATIPTVGSMVRLTDTEGNVLCAMQYEDKSR